MMAKLSASDIARSLQCSSRNGKGWKACCPAHDDHNPSLSITERDGKILVHCHAGCSQESVISALKKLGLWNGISRFSLPTHIGENEKTRNGTPVRETIYRYKYADGQHAFDVVRRDFLHGKKSIRPRLPGGELKAHSVPQPIYRLPEILNTNLDKTILIFEGEKCCEAWLHAIGGYEELATTWAGGSSAWRKTDWSWVKGRWLHLVADADEPGRKAMHALSTYLLAEHAPASIILSCPPGNGGEDIADIIELDGLEGARCYLNNEDYRETILPPKKTGGLGLVSLGKLLDMPDEQTSWLVENMLPTGGFSMMTAKPKVGKSTLARCLALSVAQGRPWLDREVAQGPVVYLALEEKSTEVVHHFRAMGMKESDPIFALINRAPLGADQRLVDEVQEKKPSLVIIDPLFRFVRIGDGNDYVQTTRALEPLLGLARDTGTHILATHHTRKGAGVGGEELLGSTALFGAVDTLVSLNRKEKYRTIRTIQRYGQDVLETIIELDETGWVHAKETRTEADQQRVSEVIIHFLRNRSEAMEDEIVKGVVGATKLVRKTLRALLDDGRVSRIGEGKKGNPYKYFIPE